jgi:hypothetical protein
MSIRPVEFNGMIQRTEDISNLKHQEDSKPLVDQQNIQSQVERKEAAARHQVVKKENSSQAENHADAREEGRGVYYTPSRKKKKEEEKKKPDQVVQKSMRGGFDIKI